MNDAERKHALTERLRAEGARYHDRHPFHERMHRGELSKEEIRGWVVNRFYYQTRVPIKDALILSKSTDPSVSATLIHRIVDHDGIAEGEGGLSLWLRLAEGVGLDRGRVAGLDDVLPAVRFACDAYVSLVREGTLLEAVAASLTEFFAPDLLSKRIAAWEAHYPWVDGQTIEYFRSRVTKAKRDSGEAIEYVCDHATTPALEDACVRALRTKCEILWAMLDAIASAYGAGSPPRASA